MTLSFELTITYTLYWFFLFYITKWSTDFFGASRYVHLFLIYFSGIGTIFGLYILFYFGINAGLMSALTLMVISIITNIILTIIECNITLKADIYYAVEKIGVISFFVVPILGYRLLSLLEIKVV